MIPKYPDAEDELLVALGLNPDSLLAVYIAKSLKS
jgi:hypothetical protein